MFTHNARGTCGQEIFGSPVSGGKNLNTKGAKDTKEGKGRIFFSFFFVPVVSLVFEKFFNFKTVEPNFYSGVPSCLNAN